MSPGRMRWRAGGALAAALGLLSSCAPLDPPELREREDPFDVVYTVYDSAGVEQRFATAVPASAHAAKWIFADRLAPPRPLPAVDKIHPTLRRWILERPDSEVVEVMVSFVDTVAVPRFPVPDVTQARSALFNLTGVTLAAQIVDTLTLHRSAQYTVDTLSLKNNYGATIRETFWLSQAALISIRLDQVIPMSGDSSVIYVRPNAGAPAPQTNPADDVTVARRQLGTLAYGSYSDNWIALLDSGVETRHRMLYYPAASPPTRLCAVVDCTVQDPVVPSESECSGFEEGLTADGGDVDIQNNGHGTSSAAILVGNGLDIPAGAGNGDRYRGVTTAYLDSYRVYDPPPPGSERATLNHAAAARAMEFALKRLTRVIVTVMQDTTMDNDMADVARFADHAYDGGIPVIAANGNDDDWGPGIPARGRKVIGVGSYHVQFPPDVLLLQARGPTSDGRLKPDILAPTLTETAARRSEVVGVANDAGMHAYGGTSGATPYAAGVASLAQRWLFPSTDAGQVYAHLILAGNQVGPFKNDSDTGAGAMSLPHPALVLYGKTWMTTGVRHVTLAIPTSVQPIVLRGKRLAAALWWPEVGLVDAIGKPVDTHNDLDLEIIKTGFIPGLKLVVASSRGEDGVFERADGKIRLSWWARMLFPGPWKLRISSKGMRTKAQEVYWAVALHN